MNHVRELAGAVRRFGAEAARIKLGLVEQVCARRAVPPRELATLQEVALFLRAYPDDVRVLRAAEELAGAVARWTAAHVAAGRGARLEDSGLAGTACRRVLSFELARTLVRDAGVRVDVDWDGLEDAGLLHDVLGAVVTTVETPALDDIEIGTRDWLERRAGPGASPTAALLEVFEDASVPPERRDALFESCEVPLVVTLDAGRSALVLPVERARYQRRPVARETWPLAPRLRAELPTVEPLAVPAARAALATARHAMVSRYLEIFPLTHADERDVRWIDCGRGVAVLLAGVVPERRCAFEALFYFLVCKNGVPIAYGPASPFLATCELGINFFEEFRGVETRFVYAQVMRVLYHLLGVRHFYVTPYGMGKRNPAALASGAFWFYRKLGFVTSSAEVEALARAEEARVAREPGHRSDARTLLRLSGTAVSLDLSRGAAPRFDSSALALAVSRSRRGAGDGLAFERRCARLVARRLGVADLARWTAAERASLERMAPALALVPDLAAWSARERRAAVATVRAKAARSELHANALMTAHPRFAAGLRAVAARTDEGQR